MTMGAGGAGGGGGGILWGTRDWDESRKMAQLTG